MTYVGHFEIKPPIHDKFMGNQKSIYILIARTSTIKNKTLLPCIGLSESDSKLCFYFEYYEEIIINI